jgi:hypothetical protein
MPARRHWPLCGSNAGPPVSGGCLRSAQPPPGRPFALESKFLDSAASAVIELDLNRGDVGGLETEIDVEQAHTARAPPRSSVERLASPREPWLEWCERARRPRRGRRSALFAA